MIVIEKILGNSKHDPVWKKRIAEAQIDIVEMEQWETQKSRCRKVSQLGEEIGISLDRDVVLMDGDVLRWAEISRQVMIVHVHLRDVMTIDLNVLKYQSHDELLKTSFNLGHALGNQHWNAVIKDNYVYIPLTVAPKVMDSVMRTHGFSALPYFFEKGERILMQLSPQEVRLLFGGAEDAGTHVHVDEHHHIADTKINGNPVPIKFLDGEERGHNEHKK